MKKEEAYQMADKGFMTHKDIDKIYDDFKKETKKLKIELQQFRRPKGVEVGYDVNPSDPLAHCEHIKLSYRLDDLDEKSLEILKTILKD